MNDLSKEEKHERGCSKAGSIKYDKVIRKAREKENPYYSSTKPGREAVHLVTPLFAEELYKRIKDNYQKLNGYETTRTAAKLLHQIAEECGGFKPIELEDGRTRQGDGVYMIAMVTLKSIVDVFILKGNKEHYDSKITLAKAAVDIAKWLEDEWETVQMLNKAEPKVAYYGRKILNRKGATPSRKRQDAKQGMRNKARRCNHPAFKVDKLTGNKTKSQVGLFLLEIAAGIGIVDTENILGAKKQQKFLRFNEAYAERLVERENLYRLISFQHEPMVEPPQDWEVSEEPSNTNTSGGYHWEHAKRKRTMCRHFYSESNFQQEAVDTINGMQKCAYTIYSDTLKVANQLKHTVGHFQPIPTPPSKLKIREGATAEEVRDEKNKHRERWEKHQKLVKKYMRTNTVLEIANRFDDGRDFYYGWSFDYRGRIYPLNTFLQIQGTDFDKSLVCFSEGCELTKSGKTWAARALAAAYIGTGDSYKTRERWTEDNEALIKRVARDPIGNRCDWEVAKEPWQFLQLCMEWDAVVIKGTKELWQVPVAIDSTASGLQLLSAMRRDKQGMKFANLLKPDEEGKPWDAYEAVLELSRQQIAKDPKWKHLTVYLQDRKVGKPALMLSVYGGSQLTIWNKIKDHFKSKGIEIEKEDLNKVTDLVIKSSKALFPAAFEALDWLKELGTIVAERDKRIQWHTPTGDLIDLTENLPQIISVNSEVMGRINVCIGDSLEPDINAMVKAFAPGFVHSWDASLVKAAFHNWTKPVALVHDSVSVLPSDMTAAVGKIKTAFKRICSGDVLRQLAIDMGVSEDQLSKGYLDIGPDPLINEVLNSTYFFN